jgi:hypothetical protein
VPLEAAVDFRFVAPTPGTESEIVIAIASGIPDQRLSHTAVATRIARIGLDVIASLAQQTVAYQL